MVAILGPIAISLNHMPSSYSQKDEELKFPGKSTWQILIRASRYNDVIMSAMTYQIISVSVVYSTVCSGADQRKHQSSPSLAFVQGIHW